MIERLTKWLSVRFLTIFSRVAEVMAKNQVADHIYFVTSSIACLVSQEFRGRSFNNWNKHIVTIPTYNTTVPLDYDGMFCASQSTILVRFKILCVGFNWFFECFLILSLSLLSKDKNACVQQRVPVESPFWEFKQFYDVRNQRATNFPS